MPFLLIRCSWFLTHSLSHGSVVPGGSSTDTSVLVQSLDSLRTPRHGHLAASWHRCHAGKDCARSAGQIGSRGRAEGDSCFPKMCTIPQSSAMVVKLLFSWQIWWCERWRSEFSRIFFKFFSLPLGRWQIPCGWMARILQEGIRREEEHIFLGSLVTHGLPGNKGARADSGNRIESFNHKKMKLNVQMQSVGLIPPSAFSR